MEPDEKLDFIKLFFDTVNFYVMNPKPNTDDLKSDAKSETESRPWSETESETESESSQENYMPDLESGIKLHYIMPEKLINLFTKYENIKHSNVILANNEENSLPMHILRKLFDGYEDQFDLTVIIGRLKGSLSVDEHTHKVIKGKWRRKFVHRMPQYWKYVLEPTEYTFGTKAPTDFHIDFHFKLIVEFRFNRHGELIPLRTVLCGDVSPERLNTETYNVKTYNVTVLEGFHDIDKEMIEFYMSTRFGNSDEMEKKSDDISNILDLITEGVQNIRSFLSETNINNKYTYRHAINDALDQIEGSTDFNRFNKMI
jgi:hypothetical protein